MADIQISDSERVRKFGEQLQIGKVFRIRARSGSRRNLDHLRYGRADGAAHLGHVGKLERPRVEGTSLADEPIEPGAVHLDDDGHAGGIAPAPIPAVAGPAGLSAAALALVIEHQCTCLCAPAVHLGVTGGDGSTLYGRIGRAGARARGRL